MCDLITIVIPVYNVENFLDECIKNIVNQTYKNLEIIIINDGSTDKSLEIIDRYSKNDDRIKIINRENKGLLYTRIEGLKKAKGKYMMYVDSDDWIDLDCIEKTYNILIDSKCDVVRFDAKVVDENGNYIKKLNHFLKDEIYSVEKEIQKIYIKMCTSYAYNNVTRQLITTELARKNIEKVNTNIAMGEDLEFNINFYKNINSIYISNYAGYNYRTNSTSISRKISKERLMNNLKDEIYVYCDLLKNSREDKEIEQLARLRLLIQINSHLLRLALARKDVTLKEFKIEYEKINELKEMKDIRENVKVIDILKFKDKKNFIAILLYKNLKNIYCFLAKYLLVFFIK